MTTVLPLVSVMAGFAPVPALNPSRKAQGEVKVTVRALGGVKPKHNAVSLPAATAGKKQEKNMVRSVEIRASWASGTC